MNLSYYFTLTILALTAFSSQAQTTVNTVPEGVTTFNIVAGTINYLSLPLEADPIYSGAISAVNPNSITVADSPAPFSANTLNTAAAPYFVKFLSGPQTGRILLITANSTSSLTLDTTDHTTQTTPLIGDSPSTFDVVVGNTFEVFPGETLGTLFGTGTSQDPLQYLVGGGNITTADVVTISTVATLPAATYFFNTSKGYWTLYGSTANANNTPLYPHASFAITRRTSYGNFALPVMGKATEVPLIIKTLSLTTSFTSTLYPVDISLQNLNFGSNWLMGSSISNSDVVNVWNGSTTPGHFDSYYQLSANSQWRKYGTTADRTTDVSSFVIPAGSTISIANRQTVSGAQSYLTPPLPYNPN